MANSPSFVSRFVDHPVMRVIFGGGVLFPPPPPGKAHVVQVIVTNVTTLKTLTIKKYDLS